VSFIVHSKASNQRWWLSLVAAISICLWAVNWLPIQSVEYRLTTNIAISQHRLPILKGLRGKSLVSENDPAFSFVIQDVQSAPVDSGSVANSDLSSARVAMIFKPRSHADQIEMMLDKWTMPKLQSEECKQITKQIRKERWLLETALHGKRRYELDVQREKETRSISTDQFADTAESRSLPRAPTMRFQLSSFVSQRSGSLGSEELPQQLETAIVSHINNIRGLEISIERLQAQTQGFLNFTGAPLIAPIAHSIPALRLMVLGLICFSIWILLAWWSRPWGILTEQSVLRNLPKLLKLLTTAAAAAKPFRVQSSSLRTPSAKNSTVTQRFKVLGIPFLGAVQVIGRRQENVFTQVLVPNMVPSMVANPTEPTCSVPSDANEFQSLQLLRRLGEGSLVLWLVILVARLMFDPAWRELVCVAPLAAIARLITGIH